MDDIAKLGSKLEDRFYNMPFKVRLIEFVDSWKIYNTLSLFLFTLCWIYNIMCCYIFIAVGGGGSNF